MKRSELLQRQLTTPLDAIQTCRDIIEGNFNDGSARDILDLEARIFTDIEILAMNQPRPSGDMLIDVDPGDENVTR